MRHELEQVSVVNLESRLAAEEAMAELMANVDDVPGTSPTVGAQRIEPSIDTTLRRAGRPLALDHLFVRGADVLRSGVAAARGASDHDALWAAIEPTVQD